MQYEKKCFVVMPFGKKDVGSKQIDFDRIYNEIYKPALADVDLPEGGKLVPFRGDDEYPSGIITAEMFQYLEYSRLALADLTGTNANVMYEIGHRHRARPSGTILLSQAIEEVPFDINQSRVFSYAFEPETQADEARSLIKRVAGESLIKNQLDSPIQCQLRLQYGKCEVEKLLCEAENRIRQERFEEAADIYRESLEKDPYNAKIYFELGICNKQLGHWMDAVNNFNSAVKLLPNFEEAWREKGIAENKLYQDKKAGVTGEESLRKAIDLDGDDFDALSSLGGILKRENKIQEAYDCYRRATLFSRGNSYPLLNAIKLKILLDGKFNALSRRQKHFLNKAHRRLDFHLQDESLKNTPWCIYDLLEIRALENELFDETLLDKAFVHSAKWQIETFRDSISLVADYVDGFRQIIRALDEGISFYE